jgi:hypothetical protein
MSLYETLAAPTYNDSTDSCASQRLIRCAFVGRIYSPLNFIELVHETLTIYYVDAPSDTALQGKRSADCASIQ